MTDIRLLVDSRNHLGEGPLWDVEEQRLYWVDSTSMEIWTCAADGAEVKTYYVPQPIGSMALRKGGGAILAMADGFSFYDFRSQRLEHIVDPEAGNDNRFNDGKVDRAGRFFAGYMGCDYDPLDANRAVRPPRNGSLYRLDPDLGVHSLETGLLCANGPCWSPDNRTFYFGDSEDKLIWSYDYDIATGAISNKRVFASDKSYARTIDGATVDAEGYIWNAKVLGGRIVRYAPDGRIDREIDCPVRNVTSVMFGGVDLDILFFTSMGRPMHGIPARERSAGGLFAIHGLGVRGLPEQRFGA
jgi:sugar lactone lactonase YvrE